MLMGLDAFIGAVMPESRAHVCVLDVSGITKRDILSVSATRKIHASEFCCRAKLMRRGLWLCIRCRNRAKDKALCEKEPFFGKCPFGVGEVVYPVVSNGRVLCIVSVGLLCDDSNALSDKIKKTAALLKSPAEPLLEMMPTLQTCADFNVYLKLAQAVADHILLLYNSTETTKSYENYHKAVAAALDYASANYHKEISIEDVARTHGLNAKYIGRLFKEQIGEGFNTYLNRVRINNAMQLLAGTRAQIIEIALECGYNNVTYFNREFKKIQGVTPSAYRKLHINKA